MSPRQCFARLWSMAGFLSCCCMWSSALRSRRVCCRSVAKYKEGSPQPGDKLQADIQTIRDCGIFLFSTGGQEVYIPRNSLSRQDPRSYKKGERLAVTVLRPALLDSAKDEVLATDKELNPRKEVLPGVLVTGRVAAVAPHGILFDLGVAKNAIGLWKHILPLGKVEDDYNVGDMVAGLEVRSVRPLMITVGAPALSVRKLADFRIGEKLEGEVVDKNTKLGAVFFDVDADIDASAWTRAKALCRGVESYDRGEKRMLEVIRIAKARGKALLNVKDLGSVTDMGLTKE